MPILCCVCFILSALPERSPRAFESGQCEAQWSKPYPIGIEPHGNVTTRACMTEIVRDHLSLFQNAFCHYIETCIKRTPLCPLGVFLKQVLINCKYRIFSIKRRGRLFKTRPRIPGVYSNPAFIRGPACVYLLNAFFSIGSLLNQEPKFNKLKRLKNVKQCHQLCLI